MVVRLVVLVALLAGGCRATVECQREKDGRVRCAVATLQDTPLNVSRPEQVRQLSVTCLDRTHVHEALDVTTLLPYSGLRSLSIHGCSLGRAEAGVFRHFPSLSALSVRTSSSDAGREKSSAGELELQPGVFDGVEKLESLDLSSNGLRLLQPGLLARLTTLKVLNLTDNRLRDLGDLAMAGVSDSLQVLDVSENSLLELPQSTVSFLSRLRQFYARGNRLRLIHDGALMGLKRLEWLDLSDNLLVALPAMLLNETRQLRELRLQNNDISVLPPGLLAGLPHLLSVNMSANRLSSLWIRGDAFSGLHRLIVLDMAGNRLQSLSQDVFADLSSLQVLDLSGNQLQSLPAGLLAPLSNLHTLALEGNLIRRLERESLSGLHVLSRLNLAHNRLTFIDMEAFAKVSILQELQLQKNQLLRVPPALGLLRQLRQLDLADNFIPNISSEALTPMQQLTFLRLAGNQLGNISTQLLTAQTALTMLDLSRNRLTGIESGALDRCTQLQAIRLDANHLSNINGLLAKLPRLVWLNASENQIEFFDYALIPSELRWLDLHNNKIREIENFYNIEAKIKLETLDLSHNEVSRISRSSVPDSIKYFILASNHLTTVDTGTFEAKYQLVRADLSSNQLSELDLTAIALPNSEVGEHSAELLLAGNPFFCGCRMDWLHTINTVLSRRKYPKVLDLDRVMCRLLHAPNRLTPLPRTKPEDFLCTYQRHCFALCHCCNYVACDCEMKCPTGCSCYHDHTWNTNIVDCSRREQVTISREIPMDATAVFADGNNIRSLDSHTFIGRKRVRFLYVNSSNVEEIQNRSLNGLSSLQVLRLENNLISDIRDFEFESLQSLRELYLHNNRLTRLHPGAFSKLRSLEVLTLKGNKLINFPVWQLTANPYLVQVQLSGNPWSCGCPYHSRLSAYLAENSAKIDDVRDVSCEEGEVSQCTALEVSDRGERPRRGGAGTLPLVLVAAGLLAIAAVAGCLLLRYRAVVCARRKRSPTASTSTGGSSAYTETTGVSVVVAEPGKLYDVFVTYSAQDTRFVNEVLAPQLEQSTPPYRLCLLRRDAPSTGYLGDAVHHCVQASRRTLMVLSRNFIDNEWCRFDFKQSHVDALRRSGPLLVLLLGVDSNACDGPLASLLKSAECLRYGEPDLWRQLRALMPPRDQLTLPRSVSDQAYLLKACYDKSLLQTVLQRDSPTPTCSTSVSDYQGGSGSTQSRPEPTTLLGADCPRTPGDGSYCSIPPSEHTYMTIDQHPYQSVGQAIAGDELYTTLEPEAGSSGSSQLRELRVGNISPEHPGYERPVNSYPEPPCHHGVVCSHKEQGGHHRPDVCAERRDRRQSVDSCVEHGDVRRPVDACSHVHQRLQRSTASCPEHGVQGPQRPAVCCASSDHHHERSLSHSLWV